MEADSITFDLCQRFVDDYVKVTEDEIRELCRPTLAEYKLPDVVHFVEELPKTTTGSSRRAEISRRMRLELAARRDEQAD